MLPDLPFEIKIRVVHELKAALEQELNPDEEPIRHAAKLSPYTGISFSWNAAIERETFKEVSVAASELDYFDQAMARNNGRRRTALRAIRLSVTRQSLMDGSEDELNTEFSTAVGRLFQILAEWGEEKHVASRRTLELTSAAADAEFESSSHASALYWERGGLQHKLRDNWLMQYRRFSPDDGDETPLPRVPFARLAVTGALQIWPPSLVRILAAMDGVDAFHIRTASGPWNLLFTREEYQNGKYRTS